MNEIPVFVQSSESSNIKCLRYGHPLSRINLVSVAVMKTYSTLDSHTLSIEVSFLSDKVDTKYVTVSVYTVSTCI